MARNRSTNRRRRRGRFSFLTKLLCILLIAGALDPVGNKGRGVKSTAALFEKAGIKDVEVKLYQGMRHEILNEPGKQQVYDDVLAWIDRHIS